MPCATCEHTMQNIAEPGTTPAWWCPRCGSICTLHVPDTKAPALVHRCREMQALNVGLTFRVDWKRLGIAESINLPANRPTEQ